MGTESPVAVALWSAGPLIVWMSLCGLRAGVAAGFGAAVAGVFGGVIGAIAFVAGREGGGEASDD